MRSAIAGTKGCQAPDVSLKDSLARFKIDACCVPLQEPIKAVESAHNKMFKAVLVLQVAGSSSNERSGVREALAKVPGVRTVSEPDKAGLIRITFDPNKKTLLTQLVKAGKDAGVTLRDPKPAGQ